MSEGPASEDAAQDKSRRSVGARRSPDSQAAILKAAEEILNEEGFRGFSIEAVARRARAGKPTIYRWWPNKARLLLDVYQRQKPDFVYGDGASLEDDLVVFLSSLLRQWRTTAIGEIFRSLIAEAQHDPDAAKALADYTAARHVQTGAIVRRAIASGEARPDANPELTAEMLSSYAWTRLLTDRLEVDDATLRQVARQLACGLKK